MGKTVSGSCIDISGASDRPNSNKVYHTPAKEWLNVIGQLIKMRNIDLYKTYSMFMSIFYVYEHPALSVNPFEMMM